MDIKYCIHCIHYRWSPTGLEWSKCANPARTSNAAMLVSPKATPSIYADLERSSSMSKACGPTGIYWTAKPKKKSWWQRFNERFSGYPNGG